MSEIGVDTQAYEALKKWSILETILTNDTSSNNWPAMEAVSLLSASKLPSTIKKSFKLQQCFV